MKVKNEIALVGALVGAGLLWMLHKKKSVAGIGATRREKRRIWREIAEAQDAGVDFTDPSGWQNKKGVLDRIMFEYGAEPSRGKSDKPIHQRYFNQLRRAYNTIAGIGKTDLPHEHYEITNQYGDTILEWNDFKLDQLPQKAANWIESEFIPGLGNDYKSIGEWATLAAIATGTRFVWNSPDDIHRGASEMLFGRSVPGERKVRISYLATPEKGGVYVEQFAHHIWERDTDSNGDDLEITDGVLDALRNTVSKGQAQDKCIDMYISAKTTVKSEPHEDVPF